jgi:hypothetical protein
MLMSIVNWFLSLGVGLILTVIGFWVMDRMGL